MYQLINLTAQPEAVISSHRTPEAAGRAMGKAQRRIKRIHGPDSYILTTVRLASGEPLSEDDGERIANGCSEVLVPR